MPGLDHQLLTSVIFEKARGWIPSNCCYIDILKISLCQRKIPAMIKVWVRKNKSTHALPMAFFLLAFLMIEKMNIAVMHFLIRHNAL